MYVNILKYFFLILIRLKFLMQLVNREFLFFFFVIIFVFIGSFKKEIVLIQNSKFCFVFFFELI